jgi:hypothetical protein
MPDEPAPASPAIAAGTLLIRPILHHGYCLKTKPTSAAAALFATRSAAGQLTDCTTSI